MTSTATPVLATPAAASRRLGWSTTRATQVALAIIAAGQAWLALRPQVDNVVFQDEGLYLFMGHRMIDHLLHGAIVFENPGSFFSGAPGFYPVLAAMVDSVAGLHGVRLLSLAFVVIAMIAVFGIGKELFGRRAGLLGAAAFGTCGSVIFQSHLATYDAFTLCLLAVAGWLALISARRDQLVFGPLVAVVLAAAFFAKYAAAAYVVGTVVLVIVAGRQMSARWTITVRAVSMLLTALVLAGFVLTFWGASLWPGIDVTTAHRAVIAPSSSADLLLSVVRWTWPLLLLVLTAAAIGRRSLGIPLALAALAVIGPAQQIWIGESTSLAKHLAFGALYAAPLAGMALAACWNARRVAGPAVVAVTLAGMAVVGATDSRDFLTGWVDDAPLIAVLRTDLAAAPGKVILGEQPSGQRYQLADRTTPEQWADTFEFSYDHLQGIPAYQRAIDQSHFGVIYLDLQTPNGRAVNAYLAAGGTPYHLSAQPVRHLRGQPVGAWLVWTPAVLP